MGVKGLWQLLLPVGRRISIETLEGKILAIDASIWLIQFVKAMRDPDTGKVLPNAHIIGFLRRICKLLYHGIRPVMVFDGQTPQIKLKEIKRRRETREGGEAEHQAAAVRMAKRILVAQLKVSKKQALPAEDTADFECSISESQGNAAFAPGFFMEEGSDVGREDKDGPGNANHTENVGFDAIDLNDDENSLKEYSSPKRSRITIQEDQAADDFAIASLLQQQEYDMVEGTESLVETMSEGDSDRKEHSSLNGDDSSIADHSGVVDVLLGEEDESALPKWDMVLSLPANHRKDIFEKAQRQRRLLARKQFIPVAADPIKYSQCQLTNFLKSSRLNQKIAKLSKDGAACRHSRNEEIGEAIASDSTRRILFVKDLPMQDSKLQDQQTTISSLRVQHHGTSLSSPGLKRLRRRRTTDDEQSEIEDENGLFDMHSQSVSSAESFGKYRGEQETTSDNFDDLHTGRGFLRTENEHERSDRFEQYRQLPNQKTNVLSREAGGFLCDDQEYEHIYHLNSDDNVASGPEKDTKTKFESVDKYCDHDQVIDLTSSIYPKEVHSALCQEGSDLVLVGSSSHHREGEPIGDNSPQADETRAAHEGNSPNLDSGSEVDWEDGNHLQGGGTNASCTAHDVTSTTLDSEGDVDWEDGISCTEMQKKSSDNTSCQAESHSEIALDVDSDKNSINSSSFTEQSHHDDLYLNEKNDSSSFGSNRQNDIYSENATTAALKQAQATASNLTNWAGRAVQRAIEEHMGKSLFGTDNESSNEKATPIVYVNEDDIINEEGVKSRQNHPSKASVLSHLPSSLDNLEHEDDALRQDRNRQQRDTDTLTEGMKEDIIQLLLLFGIPYVDAPAEAEAQCVALENLGLVDGIVTEDSDVFVFGGQKVYRNIFDELKFVELYLASDAKRELGLSTNDFIALAMLLGSDYTSGVKGVGIVNGMEILHAFPVQNDLMDGLTKFRKWLDGFEMPDASCSSIASSSNEFEFHLKHRSARTRWVSPTDFPSGNVISAYTRPAVEKSATRFTWGLPDVENIRTFCSNRIGWTTEETDKVVMPVVKAAGRMRQTRLDSFLMTYNDDIKFAKIRSERLRNVMSSIKQQQGENSSNRERNVEEKSEEVTDISEKVQCFTPLLENKKYRRGRKGTSKKK